LSFNASDVRIILNYDGLTFSELVIYVMFLYFSLPLIIRKSMRLVIVTNLANLRNFFYYILSWIRSRISRVTGVYTWRNRTNAIQLSCLLSV